MLDIKFIKDNAETVKDNIAKRFVKADVDKLLEIYSQRNDIITKADALRQKRNENAASLKSQNDYQKRVSLIEEGKRLKDELYTYEDKEIKINKLFIEEMYKIPNMTHPDTPIGPEEKDSKELRKVGAIPEFDFEVKDHTVLGKELDIIDFESGAKVSGQKFYYLKNEGALLELALIQFAIGLLVSKGFTPVLTPDLARESILEGIGFNPRGNETNVYMVENTDLCLVGTAEITLGGMYSNTVIDREKLPIKMVGLSHCFRTEAGAAGKAQKGLYRVHQFSKVEMFAISLPEDAAGIHEELREIEEEIVSKLGIPYRVLDIASGDLGNPAYKKYDLEAWMPGKGEYGEITSTSNCTDYQSRRLNVKYKTENGKADYTSMLNGTAVAIPRMIISIIENFQTKDGEVIIPEALHPYMFGIKKISKK